MVEGLARKKVRGGHNASATRILNSINGILTVDTPDVSKLSRLKLSLQEKLDTLILLDGEMLELIEKDDLATDSRFLQGSHLCLYDQD